MKSEIVLMEKLFSKLKKNPQKHLLVQTIAGEKFQFSILSVSSSCPLHPSHILHFHTQNPDPNFMKKQQKANPNKKKKKRRVKFFNIHTENEIIDRNPPPFRNGKSAPISRHTEANGHEKSMECGN